MVAGSLTLEGTWLRGGGGQGSSGDRGELRGDLAGDGDCSLSEDSLLI